MPSDRIYRFLLAALVVWTGCGQNTEATADSQPFEEAVAKYLEEHNMALAIKEVKAGPTIEGDSATMTASLTHAELGGASVTWDFEFVREESGGWKAVGHED